MNLRMVHAVLILLSAILAVLVGVWCLGQYWRQDGAVNLVAAIAAFAVSCGLAVYDSWLLRKTRTLTSTPMTNALNRCSRARQPPLTASLLARPPARARGRAP